MIRKPKKTICIVGGGITGLSLAYKLSKAGYPVTLLEASESIGGLIDTFTIGKMPLEKFYHHIFSSDKELIQLIDELSLKEKLKFSNPKTAIFYKNVLYPFGGALDFLAFKPLNLIEKINTAYQTFRLKFSKWQKLPDISAQNWLQKKFHSHAFKVIWEPLLKNKFGVHSKEITLPWFWARIASRTKKLGYINGSFNLLSKSLKDKIIQTGSQIINNQEVVKITKKLTRETEFIVETKTKKFLFSDVIITTAPELFTRMTSQIIPQQIHQQLYSQKYLGNICLVLKMKQLLSPYYWININQKNSPFVAVIEHTNFQKLNDCSIVYLSQYLDQASMDFKKSKAELISEALPLLKKINPNFKETWVEESFLFSNKYSQPIVTPGYGKNIPSFDTQVDGIYYVSMSQIYPYDRGINYSVKLANDFIEHFQSKEKI